MFFLILLTMVLLSPFNAMADLDCPNGYLYLQNTSAPHVRFVVHNNSDDPYSPLNSRYMCHDSKNTNLSYAYRFDLVIASVHEDTSLLDTNTIIRQRQASTAGQQLIVGDLSCNCAVNPGHNDNGRPLGHTNGKTFDLDYYTLGTDNNIQYGCPTGGPMICGLNKLYKNGGEGSGSGGALTVNDVIFINLKKNAGNNYGYTLAEYLNSGKPSGFDCKRNWALFDRIHKNFPKCTIRIHSALRNAIRASLTPLVFDKAVRNTDGTVWLVDDDGYSHNAHAHVDMGNSITSSLIKK